LAAKKKKGKKKEAKTSGMDWARNFEVMPYDATRLREVATVASSTYLARCGKSLFEAEGDVPKALWKAPVAVVVVANATCVYANAAACEAFNDTHASVIGGPAALPDAVPKAFESNYGKKIDATFAVPKATRWRVDKPQLVDGALVQQTLGVAYAFTSWLRDGLHCEPGGIQKPPDLSPEELQAAVADQGAKVRHLKEAEGKSNKDPAVVAAVQELLRLKALLQPTEEEPPS